MSLPRLEPVMKGLRPKMVQPVVVNPNENILQAIKSHFANYGRRINYTWQHKKAFLQVEKKLCGQNTWKGYCHDLDKLILYVLGFPKNWVHDFHYSTSSHHFRNGKVKDPLIAVLDWECCRITKPDKPYTARQYYEKFCPKSPELDEAFEKLGL